MRCNSDLIYYLSEQFPYKFMISIACFKASSIQHDVHFLIYGSIKSKKDNEGWYDFGHCYLSIDKLVLQRLLTRIQCVWFGWLRIKE